MFTGLVLIATSTLLSNLVLSRLNADSLQSTPIDLHNFSPTWGGSEKVVKHIHRSVVENFFCERENDQNDKFIF